jgi:SnoaL-like domain
MNPGQEIQIAIDRMSILQLFSKYCHLVSKCDFERLPEIFTDDAKFDYSSLGETVKGQKTVRHGVDSFIEFLKGTMDDIGPGLTHLMTNHWVEVHGDEADIISHSTVLNLPVGGYLTTHALRTPPGWRFDSLHYEYRSYFGVAKALGFDMGVLAIGK